MSQGNHPRESITWGESAAFCDLRAARLPTEAEWEYAARGSDGLAYPWGNPQGPTSGDSRVFRGGSWDDYSIKSLRGSNRYGYDPSYTSGYGGFRCGMSYQP